MHGTKKANKDKYNNTQADNNFFYDFFLVFFFVFYFNGLFEAAERSETKSTRNANWGNSKCTLIDYLYFIYFHFLYQIYLTYTKFNSASDVDRDRDVKCWRSR